MVIQGWVARVARVARPGLVVPGLVLDGWRWQLGVGRVGVDRGWVVDGLEVALVHDGMVVSIVGVRSSSIERGTVLLLFRGMVSVDVVVSPVVVVVIVLVASVKVCLGSSVE